MATGAAISIVSTVVAPVFRLLNIGGQHYYSRYYTNKEELYSTLMNVLHLYKDNIKNHSICQYNGVEIAADMLCFRNPARRWDFSDRARMKVRIQYNQQSKAIVVMCKKKYQLESFLCKFVKNNFDPMKELVLIGSS